MTKRVEVRDLSTGVGDEATKDSIVVVNVRQFLRRGDEVSPSPLFGTRVLINLGRRDCIAGLRYGIPGMRVGGTREIVISPHLAYGTKGLPDLIPPNALLRCLVELLEMREHTALLPQDWLPGKVLFVRPHDDRGDRRPDWHFNMHESGNLHLVLRHSDPDRQTQDQGRWRQIAIPLEPEDAGQLIRWATELPIQMPEALIWNSQSADVPGSKPETSDSRIERCMVVQVRESGEERLMIGVSEDSPEFRDSVFYKTIERLIDPHLNKHSESPE